MFGTVTKRNFREKIHCTETYKIDAILHSGFFLSENALGDGPVFWVFVSKDSRITGYDEWVFVAENSAGLSKEKYS